MKTNGYLLALSNLLLTPLSLEPSRTGHNALASAFRPSPKAFSSDKGGHHLSLRTAPNSPRLGPQQLAAAFKENEPSEKLSQKPLQESQQKNELVEFITRGYYQLISFNNETEHKLNRLTLQTDWKTPWDKSKISTILRLGFLSRQAYRVMMQSDSDLQYQALKKKLAHLDYQLHTLKLDNKTWAILAQREHEVIISFRGTGNWLEMINNLLMWPSQNNTLPEEERTHHGMSQIFETIWPELETQLLRIASQTKKPLSLYLAGHSLGGSFAKLTALRLENQKRLDQSKLNVVIELICPFGAPKTLFGKSRQAYCAWGLDNRTLSITNHQDIVPDLPPERFTPYESVGEQLHITREGNIWYRPNPQAVQIERFGPGSVANTPPHHNASRGETPQMNYSKSEKEEMRQEFSRWVTDHNLDNYLLKLHKHANETLLQNHNKTGTAQSCS